MLFVKEADRITRDVTYLLDLKITFIAVGKGFPKKKTTGSKAKNKKDNFLTKSKGFLKVFSAPSLVEVALNTFVIV